MYKGKEGSAAAVLEANMVRRLGTAAFAEDTPPFPAPPPPLQRYTPPHTHTPGSLSSPRSLPGWAAGGGGEHPRPARCLPDWPGASRPPPPGLRSGRVAVRLTAAAAPRRMGVGGRHPRAGGSPRALGSSPRAGGSASPAHAGRASPAAARRVYD